MPTYKNNTNSPIRWGLLDWAPGEERAVGEYLPTELNLTETDTAPIPPSPLLVSDTITITAGVPEVVSIPYSAVIKISAQTVGAGLATLSIGGKGVDLTPEVGWESVPLRWTSVGYLVLSSAAGASVQLLVEAVV